jgi:TonB family protein
MPEYAERDRRLRLNGLIALSLLLHAVILSLLFFTPSFPAPKLTFGPAYTVSLVNDPGSMAEQKKAPAALRELMQPPRSEAALRKQVMPEQAVPIRSLETRALKKDPNLERAMEEIRRKAAASDRAPLPLAPPSPDARAAAPASPAAPAGEAEMNAKMRAYYAAIWNRIRGKWALPQGILPGEVLEAVIDVTILRNGAVTEVNFEKRSGNRYFDESAMKAIQKASPFPPLPSWMGEGSLSVGIRFHSSELRS